jgi:hypothetical protein
MKRNAIKPAPLPTTIPAPDLTSYDPRAHRAPSAILVRGLATSPSQCLACHLEVPQGKELVGIFAPATVGGDDAVTPWRCHVYLCPGCVAKQDAESLRRVLLGDARNWLAEAVATATAAAAAVADAWMFRTECEHTEIHATCAQQSIIAASGAIVFPGETWTPAAFPLESAPAA